MNKCFHLGCSSFCLHACSLMLHGEIPSFFIYLKYYVNYSLSVGEARNKFNFVHGVYYISYTSKIFKGEKKSNIRQMEFL